MIYDFKQTVDIFDPDVARQLKQEIEDLAAKVGNVQSASMAATKITFEVTTVNVETREVEKHWKDADTTEEAEAMVCDKNDSLVVVKTTPPDPPPMPVPDGN